MMNKQTFLGPAFENFAVASICLLCALLFSHSMHNLYMAKKDSVRAIITDEEHYSIGYNLYATHKLSVYGYPSFFRAPGFPVFVALSLHGRDLLQAVTRVLHLPLSTGYFEDTSFIVIAQLIVLMTGGFHFYKIIRGWLPALPAIFFMLAYLVNPWTFTAMRTLSYYALDYVAVTVVTGLCIGILQRENISAGSMIAAGIIFAAACLIRPIYLSAPILIFGLLTLLKHLELKRAVLLTSIFTVAMLGAILPYSIRNRVVSGRFILISNQGPWVLWANSVTPFYGLGRLPDWETDVWIPYGAEIFTRTTGVPPSYHVVLYQYSNELSDAFNREFIKQLTTQPLIYAGNVINNFIQYVIYPQALFETKFWFALQKSYTRNAGLLQTIFSGYYRIVTIPAIALLLFLAYHRSPSAKLALLLLSYLAASYSFTYLTDRYMYGRMIVVLFSLTIIPNGWTNLFEKRPAWLSSACNHIISGLSAIVVSSPVVYLALLGGHP